MKPIYILYLKTILSIGIPFALGIAIYDIIDTQSFSVMKFVFMTLFFGMCMAFLQIPKQLNNLKKLGVPKLAYHHLKAKQEKELPSTFTLQDILKLLQQDPFFTQHAFTIDKRAIKSTNTWFSSFGIGNKISIEQKAQNTKGFTYRIHSAPSSKLIGTSSIQNLENVLRVAQLIDKANPN